MLDSEYYALYNIMCKEVKEVAEMDKQLKHGIMDACVLAAVYHEDSYGYKIVQELQQTMEVSQSTLYPVLRRLQESGCLTVRSEPYDGRLRKYYHITDRGKQRLDRFLEEWKEVMKMYEYIKEVREAE